MPAAAVAPADVAAVAVPSALAAAAAPGAPSNPAAAVPAALPTSSAPLDYDGVAHAAASRPEYTAAPVPAEVLAGLHKTLYSTAYVSPKIKSIVAMACKNSVSIDELLNRAWAADLAAGALRTYEGKIVFPLPIMRADGTTPVEISIARNDRYADALPWFATYVDTAVRTHAPSTVSPSRALQEFAYLGYWEAFLEELANLALPESWEFEDADLGAGPQLERRRYPILKSYITSYFYRVKREGKICVAKDGAFAAFNSGLVNRRYDDIYLCFEPNDQPDRCPWRFVGFCAQGVGRLGKQLVNLFNPLPQPAAFFDRKEDLLFDLDADLIINYDHVLVDNIGRLPVAFIREGLRTDDTALALLDELQMADDDRRAELYDEVRERLEADPVAFRYLRTRLDYAVELARKRVRWNYKTAIPMYYPRANTMSLLLPLCLMDESVADAALVVELMDSGNYQGQTVLTMRMAYQDARLVCRPDSDWLTTASRSECEAEE